MAYYCEMCGEPINPGKHNRKTCSDRCRKAVSRLKHGEAPKHADLRPAILKDVPARPPVLRVDEPVPIPVTDPDAPVVRPGEAAVIPPFSEPSHSITPLVGRVYKQPMKTQAYNEANVLLVMRGVLDASVLETMREPTPEGGVGGLLASIGLKRSLPSPARVLADIRAGRRKQG